MSFLSPQRLVMLVFFLQPVAFGSWLPRIPEVQSAIGLGPAALALALLGMPVGTLLTLPFAGPLVGRIGGRMAIIIGFILYSIAASLPVLAPNAGLLFVALMLSGSAISFVELGLNVQADLVEKATGRLLMNTAHGCWSLGIMAGSLIGSGFAGLGIAPAIAVPLLAALVLPVALGAGIALPVLHDTPAAGETQRSSWSLPSPALIGICLFVFGITMTEGAMADWSAIFLRDALNAEGGLVGLGYSVFAFMVATGRFGGDFLKRRLGGVNTARLCGSLAVAGAVLLYFSPSVQIALLGFGIIGVGVSVGFPLAVTAAAGIGDRAASANVAVLSFVALTGFLIGPPLIGLVAEHSNIRLGVACVIPVLIVSVLLTGRLTPNKRASPAPAFRA
ncbi:MFS transporter [Devosia sp. XJ19-1]|uniref:MFS transporter n=1 Tax=Devosia ureilytica TaxID=2952754 RepID=A0A9Q4ASJ4_9HYPH|nr:MFS transporter [Devosia ureilytica]MCP8885121.1 MFS transporter [Devosia ureilytica]MCP8888843.1 MFS transporter [Devosia ureilytica]